MPHRVTSPGQSWDRKTLDKTQTIFSPGLSEASFTHMAAADDRQDPPELTYSRPTSPPDNDEPFLMDEFRRDDILSKKAPYGLGRTTTPSRIDKPELLPPDEDALFSLYLRSPSPSCSSAEDIGDSNEDSNGGIHSQTVTLGDVCLSTGEDPYLPDSIENQTLNPQDVPVKIKKPRVTLRIGQPKPRILLRLGPKPTANQSPQTPGHVKRGAKGRRRRSH